MGAISAGLAKWFWRSELDAVPWSWLAAWSAGAAAAVLIAGLVAFGRDGTTATYGAMVLASALALWWSGFLKQRSRRG